MRILAISLAAAALVLAPAPAQSVSPVRTAVIAEDTGTAVVHGLAQESPKATTGPGLAVNVDAECVIRLAAPGANPVANSCVLKGGGPLAPVYADNQLLIARGSFSFALDTPLELCVAGYCRPLE